MTEHLQGDSSDSQTTVIMEMERKLNPISFLRRFRRRDNYCSLTTSQYWNLLTYLDVRECVFISAGRLSH